jgi:hypothetical protein
MENYLLNMPIPKLDKADEEKTVIPINDPKKKYRFSLAKYIQDRLKDGENPKVLTIRVNAWVNGYDGKIVVGNMVYDDNGLGIPAFAEWCDDITNGEKRKKKSAKMVFETKPNPVRKKRTSTKPKVARRPKQTTDDIEIIEPTKKGGQAHEEKKKTKI